VCNWFVNLCDDSAFTLPQSVRHRSHFLHVVDGVSWWNVGLSFSDVFPMKPITTPAPAPVEVEFEVCIATHDEHGTCIGYRACGKPTIDIDGPNFEWSYDDEDDANGWEWNLGPWQRMKVGG